MRAKRVLHTAVGVSAALVVSMTVLAPAAHAAEPRAVVEAQPVAAVLAEAQPVVAALDPNAVTPRLTGTATCTAGLADLTGTATPGHLVLIRNWDWTTKAQVYADANGNWVASKVAGLCAINEKDNVILEEADAGTRVDMRTITASTVITNGRATKLTATATCTLSGFSSWDLSLTGTATPGHLIQIRDSGWNIQTQLYADENGNWTATPHDADGNRVLLPYVGADGHRSWWSLLDWMCDNNGKPIIIEEADAGQRIDLLTVDPAKPSQNLSGTAGCGDDWLADLEGTAKPGHLVQIRNWWDWTIKAQVYADANGKWTASKVAGVCVMHFNNYDSITLEEADAGQRLMIMTISPKPTGDNHILQVGGAEHNPAAGTLVRVYGTGRPGDSILIRDSNWQIKAQGSVDADGNWSVGNIQGMKTGDRVIVEEARDGKRIGVVGP